MRQTKEYETIWSFEIVNLWELSISQIESRKSGAVSRWRRRISGNEVVFKKKKKQKGKESLSNPMMTNKKEGISFFFVF